MLEVTKVSKKYRKSTILNNVSLNVMAGEVVGLVGKNGAGKSTLLKMIATAVTKDSGIITLNGNSYDQDLKVIRRQIGYVPQEIALWEHLTVHENMMYFEKLSWLQLTEHECREICLNMQLDEWDKQVSQLSGGMKRKLNIAISLIHAPQLLLLDEPTAGIDLKSKTEIARFLVQQAKQEGRMILYTSHDMEEIMNYCDRVYVLGDDLFYEQYLSERKILLEKIE